MAESARLDDAPFAAAILQTRSRYPFLMTISASNAFITALAAASPFVAVRPTISTPPPARPPVAESDLVIHGPITRWDEGVPLGNGLLGGLLWGGEVDAAGMRTINLSLDRGDLWDLRLPEALKRDDWTWATIQKLHAAGDDASIRELFDVPYDTVAYPTKLPGGRITLWWPTAGDAAKPDRIDFALGLSRADVFLLDGHGEVLGGYFDANNPDAIFRCFAMPRIAIVRPDGLDKLGYAPAAFGSDDRMQWMVQDAAIGRRYAIVVGHRQRERQIDLAITIASTNDDPDPLAFGKRIVEAALERGYDGAMGGQLDWWRKFWLHSRITIPDARLQKHYDFVKYLYGSGSRKGAPPMPLQGVWTADEGGLPPWKGDFHNDLNTQTTYLAYPTAGLFECGESFLDFNWNLLPKYREFARTFYGLKRGAVVPGVMALVGSALGGWCQYSLSPTNGAWIAQAFYLHWRYTMDDRFLRERALPWCGEIGEALVGLLKEDQRGMLMLPLSSSPEIFDNSPRAFLPPNSNYDLALMRWLFGALEEMNAAVGDDAAAQRWDDVLAKLDPLDVDDTDGLTFAKDTPYRESHRHFSHAMAIHPLGLVTIEGGDDDRRIIDATLDQLIRQGTQAWCGYSFSWFACMMARCGRGDEALKYLRDYERAFTLRNGFHANGDQTKTGLSGFTYRPFTLEGNMLAMQAVHEMLLQSWGDTVRIFPALPAEWKDVSFEDLRAEGGFRVWAKRLNGRTMRVHIAATVDGRLRLRDPFENSATIDWHGADVLRDGADVVVTLRAGEVLVGERIE